MNSRGSLYELEADGAAEAGASIARSSARFTIKLNLLKNGVSSTTAFLDDWIRLEAAGAIRSTSDFRRRFCAANHFTVDVVTRDGKTKTFRVAEIWGRPFVFLLDGNDKPVMGRIMPPGWHLRQVGRSVRRPMFCRLKP